MGCDREYGTRSGWWHNPRRMQWECMDRRGQLSSCVTDARVARMSPAQITKYLGQPLLDAMLARRLVR